MSDLKGCVLSFLRNNATTMYSRVILQELGYMLFHNSLMLLVTYLRIAWALVRMLVYKNLRLRFPKVQHCLVSSDEGPVCIFVVRNKTCAILLFMLLLSFEYISEL